MILAATADSVPGTVRFILDGADLGSPVVAAAAGLLVPGDHQVGATFVPSDTTAYSPS